MALSKERCDFLSQQKRLFFPQRWRQLRGCTVLTEFLGKTSHIDCSPHSTPLSLSQRYPPLPPLPLSLPLSGFLRVREPTERVILRGQSRTWGEKCFHIKAVSHSLFAPWIMHASLPRRLMWICRRWRLGSALAVIQFVGTQSLVFEAACTQHHRIQKANATWIQVNPALPPPRQKKKKKELKVDSMTNNAPHLTRRIDWYFCLRELFAPKLRILWRLWSGLLQYSAALHCNLGVTHRRGRD